MIPHGSHNISEADTERAGQSLKSNQLNKGPEAPVFQSVVALNACSKII
jgi:hypothetical protein